MASLADDGRTAEKLLKSFIRGEIDRREFMLLCSSLSAAAILAACQSSSGSSSTASSAGTSGNKDVPLYSNQNDPASVSFYTSAIAAYRKNHPDVTITLGLYDDNTALQFLTTAFQTKHDVGVFTPPVSFLVAWAGQNLLLPIDDVVKSIGVDDFMPGTRTVVNGHDYTIPYQSNATGLWYRTDLFSQVGIKAPLATYDDLISALKELNGRNGIFGIATGFGGDTPDVSLHCLTPYIEQSGWGYFDKAGKMTFDHPEVLDGVKRYAQVIQYTSPSLFNATYGDLTAAYLSGKCAIAHYPGRIGNNLVASNSPLAAVSDFMPEPGGPFMTGKINFGSTRGFCVYGKTRFPDTAKDFLKFLYTGDNGLAWVLTLPGQVLPGLKSVQKLLDDPNNPQVKANKYMQTHADWVKKIAALVPTQCNEQTAMGTVNNNQFHFYANPNPFGNKIWKNPAIDAVMMQQIALQKRDVSAAWKDAATQMDQIAKDYLSKNPSWKPPA
jgi:ABC-type glycerol-3-phosphate transport system substrate-binding protein